MSLLSVIDSLLRDRDSLYQLAGEGKGLGKLSARLLWIFLLTSALYGATMGSFRWFHGEYFFSDYELALPEGKLITGKVAGMNADRQRVYATPEGLEGIALPMGGEEGQSDPADGDPVAEIRFNISYPSDPYSVVAIEKEGDYVAFVLSPESGLGEPDTWRLPAIVAVKVPVLFLLTLLVCSLALYMLNVASGIGLRFAPTIVLLLFALAATGAMLGVFVPIAALFAAVTEDYHFMKMMHVVIIAVAGLFGVRVLYEGLTRLASTGTEKVVPGAKKLLLSWLILYALVGGQLAWTLKPFLGTPYLPATPPFRVTSGNIYVAFLESFQHLSR